MNNNIQPDWLSFMRRLQSEAQSALRANHDGVAIVTVHLAMTADGSPVAWIVRKANRIEPASRAKSFIGLMSEVAREDGVD